MNAVQEALLAWPPRSYHLPQGELILNVHEALWPPEALFAVGARNNPRRAFLWVSKVLAKHYPVPLAQFDAVTELLAAQLPASLPQPVLFIGMAETATALAQGVFEAYLRQQRPQEALYLHSSRLGVRGAEKIFFEESHSHAPQQCLHLPREKRLRERFHRARSLILLDDELSTGTTFRALESALRPHLPALSAVHALCLTDFSPPQNDGMQRHSLLRGSWQFIPHQQESASPPATMEMMAEIEDSGCGRLGIENFLQALAPQEVFPDLKKGQRILLLGTGEFIYPAVVLGRLWAQRFGVEIFLQSSTRSPAQIWGAISHRRDFADPYDTGVAHYLYNVPENHGYDHIVLLHEHPANEALRRSAEALNASLIQFRAAP